MSGAAHANRTANVQHAIKHLDCDCHLTRTTCVFTRMQRISNDALVASNRRFDFRTSVVAGCFLPIHAPMFSDRTNVRIPLGRSGRCGWSRHGCLAWRNEDSDVRILDANGVENMGSIVCSAARGRSWRIVQLLQQWLDMRSVLNVLVGQVKGDDLTIIGVDADMKFAPGLALRGSVFFKQSFARSTKLQSRAVDDQMQFACSRTWQVLNRHPTSPAAERRMIGNGKIDLQQFHDRADQPFALTQS